MNAFAGKRVLVLEDEVVVAMMAEDVLATLGVEVVGPAHTLAEAERLTADGHLDAAILDVSIHGEMSTGMARSLQARGVPVVLATGYDSERLAEVGCAVMLSKPYTDIGLREALLKVLHGR